MYTCINCFLSRSWQCGKLVRVRSR